MLSVCWSLMAHRCNTTTWQTALLARIGTTVGKRIAYFVYKSLICNVHTRTAYTPAAQRLDFNLFTFIVMREHRKQIIHKVSLFLFLYISLFKPRRCTHTPTYGSGVVVTYVVTTIHNHEHTKKYIVCVMCVRILRVVCVCVCAIRAQIP